MRARVDMLGGQICSARLVPSLLSPINGAMILELDASAPLQIGPPGAGLELVEATAEERLALAAAGYLIPESSAPPAPALPTTVLRQLDVCPAGQRLTLLIPAHPEAWHDLGLNLATTVGRPLRFATRAHLALVNPLKGPAEALLACELRVVPGGLFGALRAKTQPMRTGEPVLLPWGSKRVEARWTGLRGVALQEGLLQLTVLCDGAGDPAQLIFGGPGKLNRVHISDAIIPPPEPPLVQARDLMGAG